MDQRTIHAPRLHKLGFLQDDSISRQRQGLMPQGLSSYCYMYADETQLMGNPYFNNVMFPIRGLFVNYGTQPPPSDCPSLSNLHSP